MRYLLTSAGALSACLFGVPVYAQNETRPENTEAGVESLAPIAVEAVPLSGAGASATVQPATVLGGDGLLEQRDQSLGRTLASEPGISSADFGVGVGRPVIRGLSGARVRVQENGLGTADVSTLSVDHAVSIDPYSADKIEVLKGPATLLYGSGAIGGVVNVVTDRIPRFAPEELTGEADMVLGDSTLDERLLRLDVTGGAGDIGWNLRGLKRATDDYRADDDRLIGNSATDTESYSAGTSWTGDWGYIGVAASRYDRVYGIPGESAQIRLDQDRYDLRGEIFDPLPGFERLQVSAAYTDYLHSEGEAGIPEAFFDNSATEARVALEHEPVAGWRGIFGVQAFNREFEAYGEEDSFVPPTDTQSVGLFALEEHPLGRWTLQGGARVEYQTQDTTRGQPDVDHTPVSLSLGASRPFAQDHVLSVSAGRYQRAPAAEELYSFGPHEATQTFERGDADFGVETARSVNIGLSKIEGRLRWNTDVFYTDYEDFIYQQAVDRGQDAGGNGAPIADGSPDRVNEAGEIVPDGELLLLDYRAAAATFYGAEAEIAYDLLPGVHRLTLRVLGDYVRGELDGDRNLPRITPGRYGAGLDYEGPSWQASIEALRATAQDDNAALEEETGSYTALPTFTGYTIDNPDSDILLYVRGDNLLDEEIVRHTSFLRIAQPGRRISTGINVNF